MGWKAYAIQPDKTRTNLRRPEAGLSCRNDLHGRLQAIGTRCLGSCYGCTDNEWKKGRDKGIPTLASSTTPVTCCSKGSDLATINMPTTSVPIFVPFQLFQKKTPETIERLSLKCRFACVARDEPADAGLVTAFKRGGAPEECAQLVLRIARSPASCPHGAPRLRARENGVGINGVILNILMSE